MAVGDIEEAEVPRRVFDAALAEQSLLERPGLAAALCAVGFDPANRLDRYPLKVWREVIEVLRRELHGGLPEAEGLRLIGLRFGRGFGTTTVGWVLARVAPLFGLERTLQLLPQYLPVVRGRMRASLSPRGPRDYQVTIVDPRPMPEFIAGALLFIVSTFEATGSVEVVSTTGDGFELRVRWGEQPAPAPPTAGPTRQTSD